MEIFIIILTAKCKVKYGRSRIYRDFYRYQAGVGAPKSSTKRLEDGTLVSPPLEDLAPFLPREELRKIMVIPLIDEE